MLVSSLPHGEGAEVPREAAPWPDVLVRAPEVTQLQCWLHKVYQESVLPAELVGSSHQQTGQGRISLFLSEVLPSGCGTEEPAGVT